MEPNCNGATQVSFTRFGQMVAGLKPVGGALRVLTLTELKSPRPAEPIATTRMSQEVFDLRLKVRLKTLPPTVS